MIIKIIILILLALVLVSLGAGMFSLIKDRGKTNRTVKFLTIRIVLSILLFVLIGISFLMGWIQPHGVLPPG
jgi:succinate dehydrogenase hydrophobic anchor subunit